VLSGWRGNVLIGMAWAVSVLFSLPMLFINGVPPGTYRCRISLPTRAYWQVRIRQFLFPDNLWPFRVSKFDTEYASLLTALIMKTK